MEGERFDAKRIYRCWYHRPVHGATERPVDFRPFTKWTRVIPWTAWRSPARVTSGFFERNTVMLIFKRQTGVGDDEGKMVRRIVPTWRVQR